MAWGNTQDMISKDGAFGVTLVRQLGVPVNTTDCKYRVSLSLHCLPRRSMLESRLLPTHSERHDERRNNRRRAVPSSAQNIFSCRSTSTLFSTMATQGRMGTSGALRWSIHGHGCVTLLRGDRPLRGQSACSVAPERPSPLSSTCVCGILHLDFLTRPSTTTTPHLR
jgi:hypothetical protein